MSGIVYFGIYALYSAFCEITIALACSSGEETVNLFFLLFVPAEALFLTAFSGIFGKKRILNRIVTFVIMFFLFLFYFSQYAYHRQFGSFYSVSLVRMGTEALGNFWWSFVDTLKGAAGIGVILIAPIVAFFVFAAKKDIGSFRFWIRPILLVLSFCLWIGAGQSLRVFGTERTTPFYIYNNVYSDTDTSAEYLGVLPTAIVEIKTMLSEKDDAGKETTEINSSVPIVVSVPTVSEKSVSTEEKTEGDNITSNGEELKSENIPEVEKYHRDDSIDFSALKDLSENKDIRSLCDYFEVKSAEPMNEYTGLFEGCNLIYICAESFTTAALNEKVTPLLCKMAGEGIVLNNYYTSYKNVTTNGEFAYLVSLWPDVSRSAGNGNAVGSFACSKDKYMPYGLGNIFAKLEVPSFAFHGYVGTYYQRCDSWPNLGFQNIKFMKDGLTFKNKWSPADMELMEQTVSDFINEDRFVTYYMTYSGHGSYVPTTYMYKKNNEAVKSLLGEDVTNYNDAEIAYLCGNYELEKALEYLMSCLEEAGKAEDTVIVLAGDHIPYNLSLADLEDLCKKKGLAYDESFEKYHSTCIIYKAGMDEPIVNDSYCCNVDVLPTVLNLLGIEFDSRLIAGIDVFSEGLHRARLYNGNLLTEYVNYKASSGKATWKKPASEWTKEEKEEYLEALILYSEGEYAASLKIMDTDFYRFVEENSAKKEK